jgi:ParB family chromosome partitioning protein
MTSLKNTRNAMLEVGLARANSPHAEESKSHELATASRVISGAVGAVSRTLDQFHNELKATQSLVASGDRVLELDTALVEDSILRDRMEIDADSQAMLIASIQENGQQVPILVRPVSDRLGQYQVAYGHRRLAACRSIGRKVVAIVRALTDRDLLVAQGQENSARRDLSYIERATFALQLEKRGLDREAIMAALSTDKTELSKLITVASSVPEHVIHAIGPAPKAGRPRWLGLAECLRNASAMKKLTSLFQDGEFRSAPSDERFVKAFNAIQAKQKRGRAVERWTAEDGKRLASIERSDKVLTLAIDVKAEPKFGQYIVDQLPNLYAAFRRVGDSA